MCKHLVRSCEKIKISLKKENTLLLGEALQFHSVVTNMQCTSIAVPNIILLHKIQTKELQQKIVHSPMKQYVP